MNFASMAAHDPANLTLANPAPSGPGPEEERQVESATGRVSLYIMATLLGGTLLICAMIGTWVYPSTDSAQILAAVATILLGAPLVGWALRDMYRGHSHMNELVALAVLAAFVQGWYLEAGWIAFFMIISVLIESRTALGAEASIESLIRITPTRATRVRQGNKGTREQGGQAQAASVPGSLDPSIPFEEEEVDAKDLRPGDVVRVLPGDNIPADGVIQRGSSTVNQANITGESLPADKVEGDEVFGGTINLTGAMLVNVTKAGEDTTLGRVKDLIREAKRTRTPILRMIDRYAAWYTPTVLMLVGIVYFFVSQSGPEGQSRAAERAIAMLVVACPAPLILATPTAMVAALSAAARLGVLIKSVIDLEAARNLTAMIFDKTGTLTTGQLEVSRLSPAPGVEGADLLRAAAAAEHNSRHPVARAVVDVARKAKLHVAETQNFEEVAGKGVRATLDGSQILVGRGNWIQAELGAQLQSKPSPSGRGQGEGNVSGAPTMQEALTPALSQGEREAVAAAIEETLTSSDAEGLSTLFVVRDGKLLGWIGLADNTRAQAPAAMDELRELGLKRLIIVTGDRESVARRVAEQMHTDYKAEVLPHEKLEIVDELKARGHKVGMIGDGVNDAPALAAGDISIAMGAAGSDVAIHSASVALMNNNLNRIAFLVRLSKETSRVVSQNLAVGIGFIIVFLAVAAAGYVTPVTAAVLQVVSSLVVVFNSARLVRSGEDIEHAEHEALEARTHGAPARRQPSVTAAVPA